MTVCGIDDGRIERVELLGEVCPGIACTQNGLPLGHSLWIGVADGFDCRRSEYFGRCGGGNEFGNPVGPVVGLFTHGRGDYGYTMKQRCGEPYTAFGLM